MRFYGQGLRVTVWDSRMENQMEKKMENEMETREYIWGLLGFRV